MLKIVSKKVKEYPIYVLPLRSLIEEKLNNLYSTYIVQESNEDSVDEAVFDYNNAVQSLIIAFDRWQTMRGGEDWDPHALIFVEKREIFDVIQAAEALYVKNNDLYDVLKKLKTRNGFNLPNFMRFLDRVGS